MAKLATMDTLGRLALRFAILTAARSGEVRGATWDEIDTKAAVWTVPAERMKAGREHRVPLSSQALAVLEKVRAIRVGRAGELVFPGRTSGQPMSDMTLTKALRDAGYSEPTVHGFRSAFRDWAAEQTAMPGDVVEAALAHMVSDKVEAAYKRTKFLEKRRELMTTWGSYLTATPKRAPRKAK
jgi:integrase